MAKTKKGAGAEPPPDLWELYLSLQLTPEQKAEARAEMERKAAVAREEGVFERLLEAMGKVHLEYDIDELREDAERWGENPSMAKTKKDAVAEVSADRGSTTAASSEHRSKRRRRGPSWNVRLLRLQRPVHTSGCMPCWARCISSTTSTSCARTAIDRCRYELTGSCL
ncbi:MAG: hypothetical protein QOH21_2693 [Acidobacteriota bacterium]|jgi:hypothetical protein|nr:hypothetical protein [Acidobacteriota bacterium]